MIILEDGRKVTAKDFLKILESYSGDIYKINDPERGPKDPNRWNKIKEIIKKVLVDGKESRYVSAYKKTLTYEGKVVEVTFQKLKDGVASISKGWVK